MSDLAPPSGVPVWAWEKVACQAGDRWAITERDATGAVIGTAYRDRNGNKTTAPGGRRGLILAWPLDTYAGSSVDQPVYVCEGASDTAALLSVGLDAVGIPMAGQCGEMLAELLADRHVVLVSDADAAGRTGTKKILKQILPRCTSVRVIEPPDGKKDAREAVIGGANQDTFEQLAKHAPVEAAVSAPSSPGPRLCPESAVELIRSYPEMREVLIDGLLRRGEVMNVVAAPKTGKSWLVHNLVVAMTVGLPWLGKATTKGKVLLIDGELHRETLASRLRTVQKGLNVDEAALSTLGCCAVRGQRLTIQNLAAELTHAAFGGYDLIVVDALYRFLPEDGEENANETMTVVYNALDAIAKLLNVAIVVVHHASKGSQSEKAITDVGSGAGSQSRAADTHLVLRPHEEEGAVVVDAVVRSFPPMTPFVIRGTVPVCSLDPKLDPTKLRQSRGRRKANDTKAPAKQSRPELSPEEFTAQFVGNEWQLKEEIRTRASAAGVSHRAADANLTLAVQGQLVEESRQSGGKSRFRRMAPGQNASTGTSLLAGHRQ